MAKASLWAVAWLRLAVGTWRDLASTLGRLLRACLGGPRVAALPLSAGPRFDSLAAQPRRWGLRVVCISDTHGRHRELDVPPGDVLIHAGDFTNYGREEQAVDFDAWLAELPHRTKLVVLGNHESNAPWNGKAAELLRHATLLRQSEFALNGGPRFFGTDFFWRCEGSNPYFEQIPANTDILIAHGPADGCADGGKGCPALLAAVCRVKPALVVSGHIHVARGAALLRHGRAKTGSTLLVNAANCGSGKQERSLVHKPVVIDI